MRTRAAATPDKRRPFMEIILEQVFSAVQCERFGLALLTGSPGLKRKLTTPHIQKPGLLLTGLLDELHSDRIQIFGSADIRYLFTPTPV